ncbi:MAG: ester cyclase [Candidatus Dormiibacterota bacterium]
MSDLKEFSARATAAFNAHDVDALAALDDPSVVYSVPSPTGRSELKGRDAGKQYNESWFTAFPDAKITIKNEVIAGDTIVQEAIFEGTNSGTWKSEAMEMPATGKSLKGHYCLVTKVTNDQIVTSNLYFDQVELMTQLGLMPEPAAV